MPRGGDLDESRFTGASSCVGLGAQRVGHREAKKLLSSIPGDPSLKLNSPVPPRRKRHVVSAVTASESDLPDCQRLRHTQDLPRAMLYCTARATVLSLRASRSA